VSLETALARIAELNSAFAPRAPVAPAPAQGDPNAFAAELQGAMAGGTAAAPSPAGVPARANPGDYPHLRGDLDADPRMLRALETLAARRGETFNVTSGLRTHAEQTRLWNNRHSNPYPVAQPGTSRHESGLAADVTIGGRAIQTVVSESELRSVGLRPLRGDAVHVELAR
jgi:D-alanyl-D-alanine carboxypeptidase